MALCLAGMHRSGTSLAASWLEACGVSMSDGRVVKASAGNDRGLFEDRDFVQLNQRAILRSHPDSLGWVVAEGSCRLSPTDTVRVWRLALTRWRKYDHWGWKDPRVCLLLESYRRALPTMKLVALRRPRDEVVDSLVRRTAQLPEGSIGRATRIEAEAVFDHYDRLLTSFVTAHPRRCVVVELEELLEDDRAAFDRIDGLVGGGLQYVPLSDMYDGDMLHR